MRHRWKPVIVGALTAIGILLTFSVPTFAYTPANWSGYWGGVEWANSNTNLGLYDDMTIGSFTSSPSGTTSYQGIWESTDNSSNGAYWVSVGEDITGGLGLLYWADNRPYYGSYFHQLNYAPTYNTEPYEVQYLGNNEWGVYQNFSEIGVSTSNPPYSDSMFVGASNSSSSIAFSNQNHSGLEYLSGGSWHSWTSGSSVSEYPAGGKFTSGYTKATDWEN